METLRLVAYIILGLTIILTNVYIWYNYGKDSLITAVIITTLLVVIYLVIDQLNPDYISNNWALLSFSAIILWLVYYAYNNPAEALVTWNDLLESYVYTGGDETTSSGLENPEGGNEGNLGDLNSSDLQSSQNQDSQGGENTTPTPDMTQTPNMTESSDMIKPNNDFIRTGINNIRNMPTRAQVPQTPRLQTTAGIGGMPSQPYMPQTPGGVGQTPGGMGQTPGGMPSQPYMPQTPGTGMMGQPYMPQTPAAMGQPTIPGMAYNMTPSTPTTPRRVQFTTPSTK